jgi:hypothetical protein
MLFQTTVRSITLPRGNNHQAGGARIPWCTKGVPNFFLTEGEREEDRKEGEKDEDGKEG